MFAYLTLEDDFRLRARTYLRRAKSYADDGNLEYAWGCLAKAARKYRWLECYCGVTLAIRKPV